MGRSSREDLGPELREIGESSVPFLVIQTVPYDELVRARQAHVIDRYVDRLGRGLAVVCDILDPDVIVLGGGMSNVAELYERTPPIVASRIFSDAFETPIVPAKHGDSSGVRGAAWLWPAP